MRRWIHGLTIRSRLTLLTTVLVFAAGVALVLGGYLWMTRSLPTAAALTNGDGVAVSVGGAAHEGVFGRTVDQGTGDGGGPDYSGARLVDIVQDAVSSASDQLGEEVARRAATQSVVLLLVLTAMALGIGWFASRRALAPVHAMTESARRVSTWSLTDRLVVDGPQDEVRELGETFNAMLDRVEGAVRGEQRLIASTSHELRTPLANQRAVLELALETTGLDRQEALESGATSALAQNERMHRLIEQLLLLARVEQTDVAEHDDVDVDLVAVVDDLARAPSLVQRAHGVVEIRVDTLPSPLVVRGDPVLVERMIGNLVENAIRYNVAGGRVDIELGANGGRAHVRVVNTGPVVAPGDADALIRPFHRGPAVAGSERVHAHDSTGLGLSIVVAIARRYGVEIDLEPRSAGGLSVLLVWPDA